MSNVLVHVSFTVDVSEERITRLMGRPDDDSDGYYENATYKAEEWVRDNLPDALESAGEPDVEAMA